MVGQRDSEHVVLTAVAGEAGALGSKMPPLAVRTKVCFEYKKKKVNVLVLQEARVTQEPYHILSYSSNFPILAKHLH